MNEQFKKVLDPIKTFWGKLTRKTKIIIFSCLGAVVVLAVVLSLAMNRTQYTVLYSGLGSDEAQQVMDQLRDMSVDYRNESGTIYVDKNKENTARMQLANEGYPKTAPNYDFFTKNVGVMTTDEEEKIIVNYQLEERLNAIIKTLDSVDTAAVTIALPQSTTYAWDDNKQAATASVAIKPRSGCTLENNQVNGIKQLVSKSVPNLKAENVTVMDSSTGEELSSSSAPTVSSNSATTQITLSEFKLKIEKQYEDDLQAKIVNLLTQAYGKGNISVGVKSRMDLDKKIQDIVTYSPSTSDGKGIVSHSEEVHEVMQNASSAAGGVAGTQSNSDTAAVYPGVTVNGNVITAQDKKTYDYLVSKVEEQIQSDAAALDDLSVGVVITTNGMTDARKQEIAGVVANAAAVDVSKVSVMAAPPTSSPASQAVPANTNNISQLLLSNPILLIAGGSLLLLIILLIVLLSARKRRARREELLANLQAQAAVPAGEELPADEIEPEEAVEEPEENAEETEEAALEPEEEAEEPEEAALETEKTTEEPEEPEEEIPTESIEDLRKANNGKEQRVKNELEDFSAKNPEIAAQLIRSWLRGDDKRG